MKYKKKICIFNGDLSKNKKAVWVFGDEFLKKKKRTIGLNT